MYRCACVATCEISSLRLSVLKRNFGCPPTYGAMIGFCQLPHLSRRRYSYAHTVKQHNITITMQIQQGFMTKTTRNTQDWGKQLYLEKLH